MRDSEDVELSPESQDRVLSLLGVAKADRPDVPKDARWLTHREALDRFQVGNSTLSGLCTKGVVKKKGRPGAYLYDSVGLAAWQEGKRGRKVAEPEPTNPQVASLEGFLAWLRHGKHDKLLRLSVYAWINEGIALGYLDAYRELSDWPT